jgi:hypothetical protein
MERLRKNAVVASLTRRSLMSTAEILMRMLQFWHRDASCRTRLTLQNDWSPQSLFIDILYLLYHALVERIQTSTYSTWYESLMGCLTS